MSINSFIYLNCNFLHKKTEQSNRLDRIRQHSSGNSRLQNTQTSNADEPLSRLVSHSRLHGGLVRDAHERARRDAQLFSVPHVHVHSVDSF